MIYSKKEVNGTLQKRINDAKFYHSSNYHNKFFDLDFKNQNIAVSNSIEDKKKVDKYITFAEIRACEEIQKDGDLNQSTAQGCTDEPQKRSRSLSGMFRKANKDCGWMYGFRLITFSRQYELYAPTRQDLQHWVKIFNLIVQMYQKGLRTNYITPQAFELQELAKLEASKPKPK